MHTTVESELTRNHFRQQAVHTYLASVELSLLMIEPSDVEMLSLHIIIEKWIIDSLIKGHFQVLIMATSKVTIRLRGERNGDLPTRTADFIMIGSFSNITWATGTESLTTVLREKLLPTPHNDIRYNY